MKDEGGKVRRSLSVLWSFILHPSSFILRFRPARPVFKTWWGAGGALLLVLGGTGAGAITFLAGQANDPQLAYYGAIACLVFVVLILLFVVPPLVRAARAEVRLIHFPVRLTAGGLLFLVVLAGVGVAAWNTNQNVLFLIASVMVSTLFVQWAAGRVSLRDTGVAVRFPDHIFAGETAAITATLHNYKRLLPALFVTLEARERDLTFDLGDETSAAGNASRLRKLAKNMRRQHITRFEYVVRRGRVDQPAERAFAARGEVRIEGFTLSTLFPFGLLESRRRLGARAVRLVIYPRIEPVRLRFNFSTLPRAGNTRATRRGSGTDLYGLRGYQPGDDRRRIDWKATARTRRLTVREFAADEVLRSCIAFDPSFYEDAGSAPSREEQKRFAADRARRFERGVVLAASLVAHFIRQGGEIELVILGDESEAPAIYGGDQAHLYGALRRLALVTRADALDAPRYDSLVARAAADGAHLIVVTAAPASNVAQHRAHLVGY